MQTERAREILNQFKNINILVIGDIMCDEYIWGDVSRISPEAPVPVVHAKRENRVPGGATNVLNNLVHLGVNASIMGVLGNDENGKKIKEKIQNLSNKPHFLFFDDNRPTIVKTRILAQSQQLLRLDREKTNPIPEEIEHEMIQALKENMHKYDAVILSDYDKGVLNKSSIVQIIKTLKAFGAYVAVDPQVRHFSHYENCDLMTPNEKEASNGIKENFPGSDEDAVSIGKKIKEKLNLKELLLTRSHKGMALFFGDEIKLIPTIAREVYDVSGAGDTVISVYTAARMASASCGEAALLSNLAGGIVVGKLGTATTTKEEMILELENK